MKKLKILGLISEDNAVGYYRIWAHLKELERLGLAELKITPTFFWGKDPNEIMNFPKLEWFSSDEGDGFEPDIIVAQRHDAPQYIALLAALKNFKAPVVVDTDDDVQVVRPFNPGYGSYNPDSHNIEWNIKLMGMADAITTSTGHLKEVHEKYGHPTYVVPNSIDLKNRSLEPRKRGKKLRIGWLGSACHWENLQIIQQAVKDIVSNYPEVEFLYTNLYGDIWGNPPDEIRKRVIPACKVLKCKDYHAACNESYVTFDKYHKVINRFKIDIGLAPLYDNMFNRSKSNLRILEYWADQIAVIASPVRPYSETIIHKENGLIAKEKLDWYMAIEKLILDKKLLNKLKRNGYKSLKEEWSLEKNTKKTYKIYKEIIKNFKYKPLKIKGSK